MEGSGWLRNWLLMKYNFAIQYFLASDPTDLEFVSFPGFGDEWDGKGLFCPAIGRMCIIR